MSFNFDIDYLKFNISDLEGIAREIFPPMVLEKAMHAALDEVETQLKNNFSERQGEWKSLALSTQRQRLRQGYGPQNPILVRSGTLRDNVASGREVQITGDELRGDVYPNDDATTPYGSSSIGDYMDALNSARPFYDLDEGQMTKVYAAFEESLVQSLGAT